MKQQFRFNPLATAILTLLCGSSIQSSYAASSDAVSSVDNQQLKQQLNESYPGQDFFQQYYVSKDSPEAKERGQVLSFHLIAKVFGSHPFSQTPKHPTPITQQQTSRLTMDFMIQMVTLN